MNIWLLRFGDHGEEFASIERTDSACLTVWDVDRRFERRSASVRGPLSEVPEDEADRLGT